MSGRTSHYGWNIMQGGDSFSDDGYKYTYADRVDIDRKVWIGAEGHHHTGATISIATPSAAPTLTRSSTGGLIPAGTRVYYKISLVNAQGQEGQASTEAFIDTTAAVTSPNAPTLTYSSLGGALLGGDYYYVLSAWKSNSITETLASSSIFISANSVTGTNKITLTLPTLPSGADGFNIYRRAPGESRFFYLDSLNIGATPATTYVDNGSVAENCDRTVPNANTTNAQSSIVVTYPGATPTVPTGYTWKIYRTYFNGNYNKSLLTSVVEFTSEATPTITSTYTDVGAASNPGSPLTSVPTMVNPPQVILTNGAEITGTLPPSHLAGYPYKAIFRYTGTTTAQTGGPVWYCEFDHAVIIGCRAALGVGASPASASVIVDVNVGHSNAATPGTQTTIYTTQSNRPTIAVGSQFSTRTTPNRTTLLLGDILSVDVDQAGGGATPTDTNLTVTIYMWVISDKSTSTIP